MRYTNITFAAFAMLAALPAMASIETIMPKPKQVTLLDGKARFDLTGAVRVSDPTGSAELLQALADIGLTVDPEAQAAVTVTLGPVAGAYDYPLADYPDEAYSLQVSENTINITAATATGVIRAAQTLRLWADSNGGSLEAADITDWPAFKLRGFMHDVGRSFIPFEELKREIDLLSRFKINTFHWHLTDNTGWRLEIEAYPQLTGEKSIIRDKGQFYTRQQARELQDFAAQRGVIIIPEIDMPGHSGPFERAMGHSMQSTEGIEELKVILKEVAELFDKAPYIHIGGDEKSFPDSYIISMIDYVHSLGKKAVIWNRYNSGPAKTVDPSAIPCDMTTNWATSGVLSPGVPNIDMRYNYTNHFDVFADVVGIFKSSIFGVERGNADVAGTISAAWNDTKTPAAEDIIRQNNIYANILASGERAWTGGGERYIEQGGVTLPNAGAEYEEFADWERRFLHHKATTLAETARLIPYVRQTDVSWNVTDQIPNGGNAGAVLPPEEYIGAERVPSVFTVGADSYGSRVVTGAGIYLRHIWHPTVKGFYDNPANGMTAYAWTYVWSPADQDAAALIEFYTYSRSGNEKAPDKGKWDRRGSRVWLNGEEIPAPEWTQPGASILQDQTDTGLTNENFTNRPPVAISLKKGWNQVFMKLPHASNGGTGRDKWQFTFVITDPSGLNALDGIVYSPGRTLDKAAEQLRSMIEEMNGWRTANVSDTPGYYPTAIAAEVDALTEQIAATLESELTAEERAAQAEALSAAFAAMKAKGEGGGISLPVDGGVYTMSTPLRFNRYPTSKGAGKSIIGEETCTEKSHWVFIKRAGADNIYDIKNEVDGTYVSPTAANNSALKTVTKVPSAGWSVKAADELGYVIITSGTAQWNQTNNSGMQFAVYNWGGGTNVSDTGCKYRFQTISLPEPSDAITEVTVPEPNASDAIFDLGGRRLKAANAPGIYIVNGRKVLRR